MSNDAINARASEASGMAETRVVLGEGPPRDPAPAPPVRRPDSVRRTATMMMSWPEGYGQSMRIEGRARDLATRPDHQAEVVDQSDLLAVVDPDRMITSIQSQPSAKGVEELVGARGGGNLRRSLAEAMPDLHASGAPLHLLLDDLAGCTLIAGFAWSRWRGVAGLGVVPAPARNSDRVMEGICSGFRPGSSALQADGTMSGIEHNVAPVPPIVDPNDLIGWHELPAVPSPPVAMRRARRIDVWLDGGRWWIDAMFRDSTWTPTGNEVAVHEYHVAAEADPDSGTVQSVVATPRILPYRECPGAAPNVSAVVGVRLADLRHEVLARIRGVDCCTHLNDALRALADVPGLARSTT